MAIGFGVLAAFLLLTVGGNSLARYEGWSVPRLEPEALSAMLSPFYRTILPEGNGPFPTALLYSGCDGPKDNLDRWAEMLNAMGWAAVIVDSHGPRDFSQAELWRLVCAGQLFMGSERAGDVLISIDDVRRMPFVDPARMVLIGSSHGGWAIMDLLAMHPPEQLPFNVARIPADAPADPLEGVVGTILLYPYCGHANRARPEGWTQPLPTLFLLSDNDSIAPSESCEAIAATMSARGQPVTAVAFAGVDHAWDQKERAAFSPLWFDAAATSAALKIAGGFLDRVGH